MPPFPEKESSLLAKLKKKKPNMEEQPVEKEHKTHPQAVFNESANNVARVKV